MPNLRQEAADTPPSLSPGTLRTAPVLGRQAKDATLPGERSYTHLRDADLQHGPLRSQTRILREPKALGPDPMPPEVTFAQSGLGGPREGRQERRAPGCQAARALGALGRLGPLPRYRVALGSLKPDGKKRKSTPRETKRPHG